MHTTIDCLPCFMKQALHTIQLVTSDKHLQQQMALQAAEAISNFSYSISPPENAEGFYRFLAEMADTLDPFAKLKEKSTEFAVQLRPVLQEKIAAADDPLLAAVKFAMAGNIIDYGAQHQFNAEQFIADCLSKKPVINDFASFKIDIAAADNILILGDNCGELVFDGLLIEQLPAGKNVCLAVKERPIINDATLTDAVASKIPDTCSVISNGTACPGTPLSRCSHEFQQVFQQADMIISKGQGNFETLSDNNSPLYFLLTVKCEVVACHINAKAARPGIKAQLGDMILLKN